MNSWVFKKLRQVSKANTKNWLLTLLCVAIWCLAISETTAQEKGYIYGKIVDADTTEPVVFANIHIKGRAVGVISNVDGSFRFPDFYKTYGDTLMISSMGYASKELLVHGLSKERINRITLAPGVLVLEETVVKAKKRRKKYSALEIVKKAINAIPDNYPTTSFSTIGYYRDYQYKDSMYRNLNEAILEVFDQGFDQLDNETSEIRIYETDLNPDFMIDSLAGRAYNYRNNEKIIPSAYLEGFGGNEFSILRIHDAIRNYNISTFDFVGTLNTDFLQNHKFYRKKDSYQDSDVFYTIGFSALKPPFYAEGILFISQRDFAIHNLQYGLMDISGKESANSHKDSSSKKKAIFNVEINYVPFKDRMYPNYISFQNAFQLHRPPVFKIKDILVDVPGGHLVVNFNSQVEKKSAQNPNNYKIEFRGDPIKVERVVVLNESAQLFPKLKQEPLSNMMRELDAVGAKGKDANELLRIRVTDVKDLHGNTVDQNGIDMYQQFREYFVQQMKPDTRAPLDDLFMDKTKPITKKQPMARFPDANRYWKNTPLQKR